MSIQATNLGIIDLGKTVVKWKIINIPGGVASLANVGVDINNLNIYNKTI